MSYIGSKPANKPVVASDLDPAVITGQTALAVAPADTDEFLISDAGVLKRLDASLIGGTNTPSFHVELASSQTVSDAAWTKVAFDTEVIDTNSAFDLATNDRFTVPSGEGGKYLIYGSIATSGSDNSAVQIGRLAPYKNGSAVIEVSLNNSTSAYSRSEHLAFSVIINLVASDYLEMYGQSNVTSGTPKFGGAESANVTFFGGYKLL